MRISILLGCVSFFLLLGCSSGDLPSERLDQFEFKRPEITQKEDSVYIALSNPLHCPLRFIPNGSDESYNVELKKLGTITVKPLSDTILKILNKDNNEIKPSFSTLFGNVQQEVNKYEITLPFLKGKKYKVIQGYSGSFSHQSKYSSYALDFDLKESDTICAADDGFVVGVIKDYNKHGNNKSWTNFANFITLYHPRSGLFTQYVHLKQNGSLVKIGEAVKRGQVIGFSGNTGYTDGTHLHFNVLQPVDSNDGLISTPIVFDNNLKGESLTKGKIVSHE